MKTTYLLMVITFLTLSGCENAIDDYIETSTVVCTEDALACFEPPGNIDLCCDSDDTTEWCWFEAPGDARFDCDPVTKGLAGEGECDEAYEQLEAYCQ